MSSHLRRLDPSKREFRLLEIQPSRNISDPIDCRLITARLTDKPEFIALSSLYSDDTPDTDKIVVNGRATSIPNHVSQALKHVRAVFFPTVSQRYQRRPGYRPHKAPRWLRQLLGFEDSTSRNGLGDNGPRTLLLWIDLLCVNHSDEAEKSQQLVGMRQIYRAAELVVGWLGVKSEYTDIGMATLVQIEESMPPRWGDPGDREKHPEDYAPTHKWAAGVFDDIWREGPHWIGGADFLTRPYLQRRWILDELAMARYPIFLIGDIIVTWKQVLRLIRLIEEFKHHPSNYFPKEMAPKLVDLPLETAQKLLDEFARREAWEDPRILQDKAFGKSTSTLASE